MKITMQSKLTGKVHTMDLPITEQQINLWQGGMLIQKAMPQLTADQREFLITGATKEEWDAAFKPDDD